MVQIPSAAEIDDFCGTCENREPNGTCSLEMNADRRVSRDATTRAELIDLYSGDKEKLSLMITDNEYKLAAATDQERYVGREVCVSAKENGKSGAMTPDGFVPRQ